MNFKNLIDKYNFETGDILLFERINSYNTISDYLFNFVDNTIKYFTNSKYTHVSMIVKNPPWNDKLKGYYVMESNLEDFPDSEDHQIKCGVELVPLEKVLSNKNNNIYFRRLHCKRDRSFNDKLSKAHLVVHNKPYDLFFSDWVKVGFNIKIGNQKRTDRFWCSALTAYLYCSLGFLNKNTNWTTISPKLFGTKDLKNSLKFISCSVDEEIFLELHG